MTYRSKYPVMWLLAALLLPGCGLFSRSAAPDAEPQARKAKAPTTRTQGTRTWSGTLAAEAAGLPPLPDAVEPAADTNAGLRPATAPSRRLSSSPGELQAQIYAALARMSWAEVERDTLASEAALDEAMQGIRRLAATPGAFDAAEMRELYRSVITAYETYHGVSDSLALAYGDIFSIRTDLFSTMNEVEQPLQLHTALSVTAQPATMTIPLHQNKLVRQSIQYLQRSPDRHVNQWLQRAEVYFPMIEEILAEEGVPLELKYLAMIESGLNPRARSHAGAVGLWQFMPATGREYGLTINEWVDERQNPEKATRAAARYLRVLHRQFDDWLLALAAYNSGPGRVNRASRRVGAQPGAAGFWDLYTHLPRETRNYVPMYVAAVMVTSDPQAYGLSPAPAGTRLAYDTARLDGMIDLQTAARLAGTDVEALRELNPELRQWITPPGNAGYTLRLPVGTAARFTTAYAALPEDARSGLARYTVRRGDTLGKIARQHGTTVAMLKAANGLAGSVIHTGQVIHLPTQGGGGTAGTPVRNASTTRSSRPSTSRTAAPANGNTRLRYRVRKGDNLTTIAQQHGVTIAQIRQWNDLSGSTIRAGETLTLYPGSTGNGTGNGTGSDTSRSSSTSTASRVVYRVRKGDNLTTIARRHSVTVAQIRQWNDLSGSTIRTGQRLTLYSPGAAAAGSGAKQWVAYHVKKGDNLTTIARRHSVTTADIRKWNTLRNDRLQVGQRLALYTQPR